MKYVIILLLGIFILSSCSKSDKKVEEPTQSEVTTPPSSLGLNSFYKKYLDAGGIPIVSSGQVADEALIKARDIVNSMVSKIPNEKQKMIQNKLRVGIIGINEKPTDMPEYSDLYTAFPGTDWNNRARAYGATIDRPLTTNCEENMLCRGSSDRYKGEEILTHEFAHAIHELGIRFTTPAFDAQLQAAYNNAVAKNLWANTYARADVREYWAEGVQCWFNSNLEAIPANGVHNQVNTRAELKAYDPTLHDLISKYFTGDDKKHGCY